MKNFLVLVDESEEFPLAIRYAAQQARQTQGQVALLFVAEPQGIETWGGVERAMDDQLFSRARELVAAQAEAILSMTGQKPLTFYRKGELIAGLLELIEQEQELSALVVAAGTQETGRNGLIQYLTSDKGLRKLKVPVIVVPDVSRIAQQLREDDRI